MMPPLSPSQDRKRTSKSGTQSRMRVCDKSLVIDYVRTERMSMLNDDLEMVSFDCSVKTMRARVMMSRSCNVSFFILSVFAVWG